MTTAAGSTRAQWPAVIIGWMVIAESAGSLGCRVSITAFNAVLNSSARSAGTRMWVPAMHAEPELMSPTISANLTAPSTSGSGMITVGDLPPSSRVTRFMVSVASLLINLPTRVEPVKEIFWTSGLREIALQTGSPRAFTTLITPAGRPAL
jgi:hypothetical protein